MSDKIGTFEYITPSYLVAGLKMRLRIKDSTDDDMLLLDFVKQGVRRLRNLGCIVPNFEIVPIEHYRAKLPDSFVRFTKAFPIRFFNEGELLGDGTEFITTQSSMATEAGGVDVQMAVVSQLWTQVGSQGRTPIFINQGYGFENNNALFGVDYVGAITVQIVGGYCVFSSNCDWEYALISYMGGNLDDQGNLMIPAIAEDALLEFGLAEYKKTMPEKYGAAIIASHDQRWRDGKAHLKGIFALPNSTDYQFINSKMNSII